MRTVVRVLIGLVAACLVAALVMVLHVITPAELWSLAGTFDLAPRLLRVGELTLLTATHQSFFILPLALVAAGVAELNRFRHWLLYAFLGVLIAAAGMYVQYAAEDELRTIANPYAARAYALEGLLAGLAYWLFAGRFSGWRRGGGLVRTRPYPVDKPRMKVSDLADDEQAPTTKSPTATKTPSAI